jgi:hypothetical protein
VCLRAIAHLTRERGHTRTGAADGPFGLRLADARWSRVGEVAQLPDTGSCPRNAGGHERPSPDNKLHNIAMYALMGPCTPADSSVFQGPDGGLNEGKGRAVDRAIASALRSTERCGSERCLHTLKRHSQRPSHMAATGG